MSTPPDTAVCTSGFRTTALPSARAGATARMDRICGKFHGLITPTTPSGTRLAMLCRPASLVGSSWPIGWVGSAAASHSSPRTSSTSKAALPGMAPPSRTSQRSNSARLSSSTRAARRISAARCGPGWAAQSGCALLAAAAAAAMSAALARPTRASTSPVAGSTDFSSPPCGVTHPLLKTLPCQSRPSRTSAMIVPPVDAVDMRQILVRSVTGVLTICVRAIA